MPRSVLYIFIVLGFRMDMSPTTRMQIAIIDQVDISKRNQWMPSLLAVWKDQRIAHRDVTVRMLGDPLQVTGMTTLNDDISIQWLVVIFGLNDDGGDLIHRGPIVTTWISNFWIKHREADGQLFVFRNPFGRVFPKLYIGIDSLKDPTQQLKDFELQIWVSFRPEVELLLSRVKHVNLCEAGSLAGWGKQTTHRVMKSTLNSKGIDSGRIQGITDGSIEFDAEGGERHRIIIRTNVLLKLCSPVGPNDFPIGIDTCLSEEYSNRFRSVIRDGQLDSTLGAAH